eukprot:2970757-Amphidinium_carterae.1
MVLCITRVWLEKQWCHCLHCCQGTAAGLPAQQPLSGALSPMVFAPAGSGRLLFVAYFPLSTVKICEPPAPTPPPKPQKN